MVALRWGTPEFKEVFGTDIGELENFISALPTHQQLQNSWWYDARRFLKDLESPEQVATEAARRAVRMLGAKKVKSQHVPVVFDPMMAASFIGGIAGAHLLSNVDSSAVKPYVQSYLRDTLILFAHQLSRYNSQGGINNLVLSRQ